MERVMAMNIHSRKNHVLSSHSSLAGAATSCTAKPSRPIRQRGISMLLDTSVWHCSPKRCFCVGGPSLSPQTPRGGVGGGGGPGGNAQRKFFGGGEIIPPGVGGGDHPPPHPQGGRGAGPPVSFARSGLTVAWDER